MTTEAKPIHKDDGGRKWIGALPPLVLNSGSPADVPQEAIGTPEPAADVPQAANDTPEPAADLAPGHENDLAPEHENDLAPWTANASPWPANDPPRVAKEIPEPATDVPVITEEPYFTMKSEERSHLRKLIRMFGVKKVRNYFEIRKTVLQFNMVPENATETNNSITWINEAITRLTDQKLL